MVVMLEDLGFSVREVPTGPQALELLRTDARVDLVLTDQAMPGMTGLELAAAIQDIRPALPVLLATGFVERQEVSASGLPLLSKPFTLTSLAAAVASCLDRRQAATV